MMHRTTNVVAAATAALLAVGCQGVRLQQHDPAAENAVPGVTYFMATRGWDEARIVQCTPCGCVQYDPFRARGEGDTSSDAGPSPGDAGTSSDAGPSAGDAGTSSDAGPSQEDGGTSQGATRIPCELLRPSGPWEEVRTIVDRCRVRYPGTTKQDEAARNGCVLGATALALDLVAAGGDFLLVDGSGDR